MTYEGNISGLREFSRDASGVNFTKNSFPLNSECFQNCFGELISSLLQKYLIRLLSHGSPKKLSPLSFHLKNRHPRLKTETANHIRILDHLKNYHPKLIWRDDSSGDPCHAYHESNSTKTVPYSASLKERLYSLHFGVLQNSQFPRTPFYMHRQESFS